MDGELPGQWDHASQSTGRSGQRSEPTRPVLCHMHSIILSV